MKQLSKQTCEACSIDATVLCESEIEALMPEVPGWERVIENDIQKLKRVFQTGNYTKSIQFTNAVAQLAETADHHPLIIVEYSLVTVVWWSHKIKGLHKNDFIMAAKTSELF